jgi:hypothetical protein
MQDKTTAEEFQQLFKQMQVVPVAPEFRLYYDENGRVMFYTSEKPEGNYIVIDSLTYSEGRQDIRVLDGVIHKASEFAVVTKLELANEGTVCAIEDVSIIVSNGYMGKTQTWKAETHEYKYH